MDDQGKRLLLSVGIVFGIMVIWQILFPPELPPPPPKDSAETAETAETAESVPAGAAGVENGGEAGDAGKTKVPGPEGIEAAGAKVPTKTRAAEQELTLKFDELTAVFSSYGGAIKHWELGGKRFVEDGTQIRLSQGQSDRSYQFQVSFPGSTFEIPAQSDWVGVKHSDTEVSYTYEDTNIKVEKHYSMTPVDYTVQLTVDLTKKAAGEAKQRLSVSLFSFQDPDNEDDGGMSRVPRYWAGVCNSSEESSEFTISSLLKGGKSRSGDIHWGGFVHSYFLVAMAPPPDEQRIECNVSSMDPRGTMRADLVFGEIALRDGDPVYRRTVTAYLGPKFLDKLAQVSRVADMGSSFREAVDLGFLAIIAEPLLWLLKWFFGFVGNWGIAIILLTIVVKLATLPWTTKSMRSMKQMSKLRPQMEKIKEKYAEDKQRQQVETMNLFKNHGVNPLAGCLPMVLQMPIWFALYRALTVAAELYHAPFIPGWINDLTAPDPYCILPVALTGMMFLQTRLTPATATGAQQKIMTYGIPIMFGGFSFMFPAGLTLYIFTNTMITAGHHLWMRRDEFGNKGVAGSSSKGQGSAKKPIIDVEAEESDESAEAVSSASGVTAGRSNQKKRKNKKKKRKS